MACYQNLDSLRRLKKPWRNGTGDWDTSIMPISRKMAQLGIVEGMQLNDTVVPSSPCRGCIYGKQHRASFPKDGRTRATRFGQLTHSDVCGPMKTSLHTEPVGCRDVHTVHSLMELKGTFPFLINTKSNIYIINVYLSLNFSLMIRDP